MVWKSEPIKHFLEIKSIGHNRKEIISSKEYTPKKYSTDISISVSDDDAELRVKPYTLEDLKQIIEMDYPGFTVNELFVGIRNKTDIEYMGMFWTQKGFGSRDITQYCFRDNQPGAFHSSNIHLPKWPLNRPPVLEDRLIQCFNELKKIRPECSYNLGKCMSYLIKPGPEYTGRSDGSVSFELKK